MTDQDCKLDAVDFDLQQVPLKVTIPFFSISIKEDLLTTI